MHQMYHINYRYTQVKPSKYQNLIETNLEYA